MEFMKSLEILQTSWSVNILMVYNHEGDLKEVIKKII